jgi:hypothetical protein
MALQTRSTQAWEFIDGPSQPRQRQLPANLWELHREEIVRLYENSGLTQARHLMKIRHGFVARYGLVHLKKVSVLMDAVKTSTSTESIRYGTSGRSPTMALLGWVLCIA